MMAASPNMRAWRAGQHEPRAVAWTSAGRTATFGIKPIASKRRTARETILTFICD
jgi:hypothetical protein